jgi:tripartite-type tricarboxylate transporter receptor subunit TctC
MVVIPGAVGAADWKPDRVVEIIVATGAGGGQDKSARTVQRILQEGRILPVAATVQNKPGGGGLVAWTYLNQKAADGHFIAIANPTLLTNHITGRSNINYTDLTMVANLFTESVAISVRAESPIRSIKDLSERLRKDPASVSFSVGSSLGSANHIAMARLARLSGADPRKMRAVVFQGGGQAMTDVLGGNIPLVYTAIAGAISHIRAGKLHAVAVSSAQRASSLPDVATFIENGLADFDINSWVGLLAPAKTPKAIVDKLNAELNAVLSDPAVRERLTGMGIAATPGSADKFAQEMQRDLTRYGSVVKSAGIKLE